jgi:hypothetical protein
MAKGLTELVRLVGATVDKEQARATSVERGQIVAEGIIVITGTTADFDHKHGHLPLLSLDSRGTHKSSPIIAEES